LYTFTGGQDGGSPEAGLTMNQAGNLYGTTGYRGNLSCAPPYGCGTVYELKYENSTYAFNLLSSNDYDGAGAHPYARVIFGADGLLYGTTLGRFYYGPGTVFNLKPPPRACTTALCPWTGTTLYSFPGCDYAPDGCYPGYGDLIFDKAHNIYGTTISGGNGSYGVVYELMFSNGSYTINVLHGFSGLDGANPEGGVILDNSGNIYGTTWQGGTYGYGTVYELMPAMLGYTEMLLHSFSDGSDGAHPWAGVTSDVHDPSSGNLFGAASDGGANGGGTVFELIPMNGSYAFKVLYSFSGTAGNGCGPRASLTMDPATGNLYGTTFCDGANGYGNIFELTNVGGGNYAYTDLYDFTGGNDGGNPMSNVIMDSSGNLYGTASGGGAYAWGVVWEITP
jgi:uncharacterized repeat protein (TIGR03803 family)